MPQLVFNKILTFPLDQFWVKQHGCSSGREGGCGRSPPPPPMLSTLKAIPFQKKKTITLAEFLCMVSIFCIVLPTFVIAGSKEPASCSLHCFLKGLQIQVYLFHAHNRVVWRLRWPYPRGDQRLTSPNTIQSNGAPPSWSASARYFDTCSRRARHTRLAVWSSTAVCCFYVNNGTARGFYYHTEHVHGGRREFHGEVKKTTSSLENCVSEIENGKYWFHSTLESAAVS